jgi:AcrR family transcriptional regulator
MNTNLREVTLKPKSAKDQSARAQIVAVARQHFMAHGFRGVTMDDLAGELGMSKKTFYAHFESKRALIEAVLREKLAHANADFERISSGGHGFPQIIHELLACVHHHTGEIQPSFVRDLSREAPEIFKLVEDERREMIRRHFGKIFADGRKRGTIRKDIAPELIIEILVGATQAVANPTKVHELNLTPKAVLSAIITIILEGVLTEKGRGLP